MNLTHFLRFIGEPVWRSSWRWNTDDISPREVAAMGAAWLLLMFVPWALWSLGVPGWLLAAALGGSIGWAIRRPSLVHALMLVFLAFVFALLSLPLASRHFDFEHLLLLDPDVRFRTAGVVMFVYAFVAGALLSIAGWLLGPARETRDKTTNRRSGARTNRNSRRSGDS